MKYFFSFVIFLVGFLLQTTIMGHLSILGVSPNLILCMVIVFAFLFEGWQSLAFGTLFGLMQDLGGGQIVGIAALCYFLIGLGIGAAKRYINRENMLSAVILSIGGTVLFNLFYWLLSYLFGADYHILLMLKMQPVSIVYNIVITIILYLFLIRKVVKHPTDKYIKGTFVNYE